MKRKFLLENKLWPLILGLLGVGMLSGCVGGSSPPGPNMAGGAYIDAGYELLEWPDGISILIWHDVPGDGFAHGSGGSEDTFYEANGASESEDGRFTWQLQSADGQTVQFRINENEYELTEDTLFLVSATGGTTQITELKRDLSGVTAADDIVAFSQQDEEIAAFVERVLGE